MREERVVDLQYGAVAGHDPRQRTPRLKQLLPHPARPVGQQRVP